MSIKPGDRIPPAEFFVMGPDGRKKISSGEIFAGKKIVLFAVPGAFTGTCHKLHVPSYLHNIEAIKAKGIRIWTIAFTSGSSAGADLTACASPNSSFNAGDSTELNDAFQEIAKQVGELRITQ